MLGKRRAISGAVCLLVLFLTYILREVYLYFETQPRVIMNTSLYEYVSALQRSQLAKKTQIAYLKSPKTGSTTMSCLIMRFGLINNLKMCVPLGEYYKVHVQRKLLLQGKHFDIFAYHSLFDYSFFTHIIQNPAIIGIVRDPLHQFVSRAFFAVKHRHQRYVNMSDQDFIDLYITLESAHKTTQSDFLSIPEEARVNKNYLQDILNKRNSEFTLMLVLERFEESLVLMKRLLNWSFMDIVFGIRKLNPYQVSLSRAQKEQIRKSLDVDYEVYKFFSNELDKRIRSEGNDFQGEVDYFGRINRNISRKHAI